MRGPAMLAIACAAALHGQTHAEWIARVTEHADRFEQKAGRATTVEKLVQRALNLPPHARFAIGNAARPLYAQYLIHEMLSGYSIGPLKTGASETLVEYREIVSFDGKPRRTPESARKALAETVRRGEIRTRKKALEELGRLGLVDVATDYGLMLLLFTKQSQAGIEWAQKGEAFVGAEEAVVFAWKQTSGGALAFLDGKAAVRPMRGHMWLRRSDGAPLRLTVTFAYEEQGRSIREDATIDYVPSKALDCVVPASVAHRHLLNGVVLTENLYTYEPFRLFTTDTRIEYETTPGTSRK